MQILKLEIHLEMYKDINQGLCHLKKYIRLILK